MALNVPSKPLSCKPSMVLTKADHLCIHNCRRSLKCLRPILSVRTRLELASYCSCV